MSTIEQFAEDLTKKLIGFNIYEDDFDYVYLQGNIFGKKYLIYFQKQVENQNSMN